jgi:Domain of unknown function (DUF4349)
MFHKIGSALLLALGLTMAACGSAAPQLIGSYPQTGQTYAQPPINSDGPVPQHLQIDYNAALELEVENPPSAIYSVKSIAEQYGGYLISSETWNQNGDDYATVTVAVPVGTFEAARTRLKSLGNVRSESTSGELRDQGPAYLNEFQTYSNITISLTPTSANWGRRFGNFVGGLATVLFWVFLIVTPIALMLIGFVTCMQALANWIDARGKRQP